MAFSENIRRQLLASFRAELKEHIQSMTDGLLALEQGKVSDEDRQELLDDIFRDAHSLKGAARTVDAKLITDIAHALEDVLDRIRKDTTTPTPELYTVCYQSLDAIQMIQGAYESDSPPQAKDIEDVLAALSAFQSSDIQKSGANDPVIAPEPPAQVKVTAPRKAVVQPDETKPVPATPKPSPADTLAPMPKKQRSPELPAVDDETIRVRTSKLDTLMAQLSELLLTKIRIEQRLRQLQDVGNVLLAWQDDWLNTRGSYNRLLRHYSENSAQQSDRDLTQVLGYLDASQEQLTSLDRTIGALTREYANDTLQMSLVVNELEQEIKQARMLPLNTILTPFARMVRDLAYECNKEAMFQISGADTELDKRVLEQIKDPLTHLLRNAVDHGIESPDERQAAGKPRYGTITLSAEQVGQDVVIRVSDDGRGLNLDAIRAAVARFRGAEAATMNQAELEQAIFGTGVSTSSFVTDVSGRGIGLDVVRRNVELLRGRIDLDWTAGEGTCFILTLPLNLSSTRGLLVQVGGHAFAIPLNNIERLLPFDMDKVVVLGGHDAIRYHEQLLPLVRLSDVLGLPSKNDRSEEHASIVVLASAEKRLAFVVDDLEGEQEIVNKGLGKQLERVGGIAGATILGSGEIVMVLNVADLIKIALRSEGQFKVKVEADQVTNDETRVQSHLLIVDDSITTRTLEKNILEAAGFRVRIATNGQEAWDILASEELPDLVVSDVSMPRMDGITLTTTIKNDERTAELPVILVTSLDSPQDKARGVTAGADAYISKGAFDQNNLLDTVRRLI